jgi:hypothetical protein
VLLDYETVARAVRRWARLGLRRIREVALAPVGG